VINQPDKKKGGDSSSFPPKITIIGVGNELLSDEGVGVHIIKELREMDIPPGIEVIEGGTDGFGLFNIICETDYLVVIDSLKGGGKAGSIYRFNVKDAPNCPNSFKTSVHQIGILEILHLSGLIGKTPKTIIFGIEPKKITTGMELSPEVQEKIPRLIELVLGEINELPSHNTQHQNPW
jgi:hydrogenase maturation protease